LKKQIQQFIKFKNKFKKTKKEKRMEKYRKLKVIGKGSFGFAVLVQSVNDRQTYVMKIIDVSKMDRK